MIVAHQCGSISHFNRKIKKFTTTFGSNVNGYRKVVISQKNLIVHRLIAQAHFDNYSDDLQVNHINGNKSDNRIENLQMVTAKQNSRSFCSKPEGKSSKYRGVSWYGTSRKWRAQIRTNGKYKHIGYFHCEMEAARAYDMVAINLGFDVQALNSTHHNIKDEH